MAEKKKYNFENVVTKLVSCAEENGYSLIINGSTNDDLHIVAYPFKGTVLSQEKLAHLLYGTMEDMGVLEQDVIDQFKKETEPDSTKDFVFSGPSDQDIHISVFHNKNIILKQIYMKI